jgi:hypothetical protein
MLKSLLVTAAVLASVSTSALAQSAQRGTADEQKACTKDVSRHCRSVMDQGDFVVLACLQQNRAKISAACNKVLTDHGQ